MTTTPLPQMLAEALDSLEMANGGTYLIRATDYAKWNEVTKEGAIHRTMDGLAAALLATPALAPLLALAEAAEKWRDSAWLNTTALAEDALAVAVDAFRGSPDR